MRKAQPILWLLLLLFYVPHTNAQNIGGVINSYYQVIEIIPAKACVRVTNPAGLLQYDNAMLVQMKGATVSTANDNTFGTVTQLDDAGNYELVSICGIRGDSVFFLHTLKNTYTISGKVQLVRIPEYPSATVTSPLMPAAWDNVTGTGGVLALIADNTLTLNDSITADTMGFKGGAPKVLSGTCGTLLVFSRPYYNPAVSTGGGYKGEGITQLTAAFSGGLGPAANGGGGGNDHNNGGAGGGNLSPGGGGGNNNSTSGCRNKFPGWAGLALSNAGSKIYFGGGGGNGHGNNTVTAYGGGNGGGIIFIKATTLVGNNFTISSRGEPGSPTIGDGASGGGAGGTIIMDIGTYSGNTNILADGGTGGDVDNLNIAPRSMGPGGGGAGGVVYFTGLIPFVNNSANGGAPGVAYNTNPVSLGGNNGATSGLNGNLISNYTIPSSNIPASYCNTLLLPLSLLYFNGAKQNDNVLFSWGVSETAFIKYFTVEYSTDSHTWNKVEDIYPANPAITQFRLTKPLPRAAINYYRLKVTGKNTDVIYSGIIAIKNQGAASYLGIYPNPAKQFIELHALLTGQQPFQLFSTEGKLLSKGTVSFYNNKATLTLISLPPGVYIIDAGGMKSRVLVE